MFLALACTSTSPTEAPVQVPTVVPVPAEVAPSAIPDAPALPPPDPCWADTPVVEHVPPKTIPDLNGDGQPEVWSEQEGCGSGECSGTWSAGGPRQPVVAGQWSDSFGSMLGVEPIPAALAGTAHDSARREIEVARGLPMCAGPDPGLSWLLSAMAGSPEVRWLPGTAIQTPGLYWIVSDDAALAARFGTTAPFWLAYKGHTQTVTSRVTPRVIASVDGRELVRFAHGLVLVDVASDRHAWIWVTSGNQKLRWPTVCDGATVAGHTARVALLGSPADDLPGWLEVDLDSGAVVRHDAEGRPDCAPRP